MTSRKDLISVRVTQTEKLQVKQEADKLNMTMTDYVRHALLADNVKQSSNEHMTDDNGQLSALLNQLEVKDKELTEKNKQIDSLHKLLDQQQALTLSNNRLTTDLQKQLETEQEVNRRKWYQFWRD